MSPKEIANKLMNIPRDNREWLIQNVSPDTFVRWCKQNSIALRPYKTLNEKVHAMATGADKLSDLAVYERSN